MNTFRNIFNIVSNYQVLLADELDVLFLGKNKSKEWVIGSLASDDEELNELSYFYLVIAEHDLQRFLLKEITYRELYHQAQIICKATKDINENVLDYQIIKFDDIEAKWLPGERSFCPESIERKMILESFIKKKSSKKILPSKTFRQKAI